MTTFDRYLLGRFWHVFGIGFFATVGLYVVFDGFTNIDAFQDRSGNTSAAAVLARMAEFYSYQSLLMFDLVGPILIVISVMVVFALLLKNRELYPILSAGVPALRLVVPMLIGALLVNGLLILNQEWILPSIAGELLKPIGTSVRDLQRVHPCRDFSSHIELNGEGMILAENKLVKPEFLLPAPELSAEITLLKADHAIYQRKSSRHPAGWRLIQVTPTYSELTLTAAGKKVVRPLSSPTELFVATEIGGTELCGSQSTYRYQSTLSLVERLRNPASSLVAARAQVMHLHERMTRPLGSLLAVCLAVPLVLRRESFSIITNLAICCGVMLSLLMITQVGQYFGRVNWISLDLAAWLPIIVCGGLVAWFSERMQT